MLCELSNWEPRGPGRNIQRWNGRDHNGLMDIREEKVLGVVVSAFQLPENAIITTGNSATDYRTYRKNRSWPDRIVQPQDIVLVRGETRVSRQYYLPRYRQAEPRVTLFLSEELPHSPGGLPRVKPGQLLTVKMDIAKEDRWLMHESLYEIGFFVDHIFVAEEERGYVPLTWQWKVSDLTPGRHMMTVNVSGFGGKVGVASLLFEVAGEKEKP